ncbi:hypothetical protein LWI28_015168 [Acer negundo]|uniref:Uncharacterized protein n=1 Tax=Acer negundo TaxID=4023 RepID=A0AAD5IQA5_ACENE|nr:hypothetical protein LWI28_015168 [Acer negundo]
MIHLHFWETIAIGIDCFKSPVKFVVELPLSSSERRRLRRQVVCLASRSPLTSPTSINMMSSSTSTSSLSARIDTIVSVIPPQPWSCPSSLLLIPS